MYSIPSSAVRIKYLESTGTQWIDTGIIPSDNTVVSGEFSVTKWVNWNVIFGSTTNGSADRGVHCLLRDSPNFEFGHFGRWSTPYLTTRVGQRVRFSLSNTVINENGQTKSKTASEKIGNPGGIVIFGWNNYTGVPTESLSSIRLYSFSIYEGTTLVRSFVPVRVGSTGCLFDRVSGQFFYNGGIGDFLMGSAGLSIFSCAGRHLSDTGNVLAGRATGSSSGTIKPVRRYYELLTSYIVDECNGNVPTTVEARFPSSTYSDLNYTPVKSGYRFAGWATVDSNPPYDAEVEYLEGDGDQYINTGIVASERGWFRVQAEVSPDYESQAPIGVAGDGSGSAASTRWLVVMYGKQQTGFYDRGTAGSRVSYTGSLFVDTGKQPFEIVLNSSKRVYLFSQNQVPTAGQRFHGKVFVAQLWDENDNLVLDLHPVRVGTTGYMHDRVSNSLLQARGNGEFVVGPDMLTPNMNVSDHVVFNTGTVYASWQTPSNITFDATTNGGQMPSGWVSPNYYSGQTYGTLPKPTKEGNVFVGWFIGSSAPQITESSTVVRGSATLVARYVVPTYDTSFVVTTTSGQKNTGIYAATARNASNPTIVDWGDGSTSIVYGNISKLAHTYSSVGTFTVRVNDNISSFAMSANDSTWFNSTSQNRYTLKKVTAISSNVTSLPTYAFNYCVTMTDALLPSGITAVPNYCFNYCQALKGITIPSNYTSIGAYAFQYCNASAFTSVTIPASVTSIGNYAFNNCQYLCNITFESATAALTLGTYCFQCCFYQSSAVGTIDMSTRKITTLPNYCFCTCRYLKGITFPQGLTTIAASALRQCFYNPQSTGTLVIPEGVTTFSGSYAIADCLYLTEIVLPSTLTNLNNYALRYCVRLTSITCNRSTAPTVYAGTFGSGTDYTGRNTYSAGTNKLYVPAGATGYTSSYWNSILLDSTKCGFTLEEIQQ